ncbi:Uncharacterised protein [Bordetella pertussis]|nr:Uncharacterised protein [Bordetella pertussis]
MQGARQRRRLERRDAMLGGELADAGGDQPGALGDHARRAGRAVRIFQRHRVMGRVGHHHVGAGHLRHHAPARHGALLLADAALHMGVALAFLVFLPHIFLGHAQLLQMVPDLPGHIQQHHEQQRAHDQGAAQRHQRHGAGQRGAGRHVHQAQHVVVVVPDHPDRHPAHQRGLGQRLDQFDHGLGRKHALDARPKAQFREIRLQRLGREDKAAQQHRRQHRHHGQHAEHGQHRQQRPPGAMHRLLDHHARVLRHPRLEPQATPQHAGQALVQHRTAQPYARHAGGQHHERAQLARTRNLPLLARLFQAPGRGGFGLFKIAFFGHARRFVCSPDAGCGLPAEILGGRPARR